MDIDLRFRQYEDQSGKFWEIKEVYSKRRDLHAFITLDRLLRPSDKDIIEGIDDDGDFILSVNPYELNVVATDDQILELVKCGIRYDDYLEKLKMDRE